MSSVTSADRFLIAADTGGTFTDLAVYDCETGETRFGKTLTTYGNLVDGVIAGLEDAQARVDQASLFKHGTTHVINSFIQRKGCRAALVTTKGFRDVLEIARGNRPETFNLRYRRDPPLVQRSMRFEVIERVDGQGNVLQPLDVGSVEQVARALRSAGAEAVAISLLNAYANAEHEKQVREILRDLLPGVYITIGTELSREWMEYERTSTAVANAFVGAQMAKYVEGFEQALKERAFSGRFYMMGSNGGVMSADAAIEQPVALVESGPIGGCIGAAAYAKALGISRMIAFDMGGTTAKCALVENAQFDVTNTYWVGGYERGFPLRTPVLDIVEVGAGGGSIAWLDDNTRLRLGPKSAGSDPGPVCFGRGGDAPTVTDANLVLGRIGSDSFMNGRLKLDEQASFGVIDKKLAGPLGFAAGDRVDRVAQGILDLATVTMSGAIKEITVERGRNILDYQLFVFGGGGPLFGGDLARNIGIRDVIVPPHPGAFSSLGMLMAEARRDASRTFLKELSAENLDTAKSMIATISVELRQSMSAEFDVSAISFIYEADISYIGQSHTVRVPLPAELTVESVQSAFEAVYRARYGHLNEGTGTAFVVLRVGALVPTSRPSLERMRPAGGHTSPKPRTHRSVYFSELSRRLDTPVYARTDLGAGAELNGPAIVEEYSSTVVVGPKDKLVVGEFGELRIRCEGLMRKRQSANG
ncbi:acetophenone carboxylase gamma subunit [Variibacter gotjawalensis]|uniref:Acetophenone carboxylase gamma subunit n=1 Tax=Variibacter gotjawalensis TaxID=1333996 RepID=A0A0S3PU74_9BRAD|nr:hydantoinase/oxoprolinase family protein [Variibacter gotjawalensis]NIK49764.1 N-methylhydantoinase A [Variibacter gotjawalensis]RZS45769.1 N-methylhydantoinase A [Variibacter gotjawalensis]BAT59442.1 acetophenone carboxylase gamma subunit [Variibacter gotjawalensis]